MSRRHFRDLRPDEVLMLAIDVEQVNATRLRNFVDMFADYAPEAAGIFAEMAAEEDVHRSQLESLYRQRYGPIQGTLAQDQVPEVVEAHDLDDAEHQIFDSLSVGRALEIVLKAECQAQDFYRLAAEQAGEPHLQALFQELSGLESSHVQRVEERLRAFRGSI